MGAPLDTRDAALWVTIREGDDGDMSECLLARSTLCDPWRTKFVQDGDDTSSWCLAHSFGSGFLTAELAWRVRTSFAHTARATLHRHGNSLAQVWTWPMTPQYNVSCISAMVSCDSDNLNRWQAR